ncbi:MAG: acetyl-CoA decarbonylase/synthase complex subunit delta [Chloroflexi bacterium]|nr:acetyl-CoA decarbonylase/synthase complex subunit delta [Chloroflexota bacterium]
MGVTVETPKEKWTGKVRQVTLGATPESGGTRKTTVTVGGETTLPFLHFEGQTPHRPAVAVEIQDRYPEGWAPALLSAWGDTLHSPAAWASKAEELGADLILLRLSANDAQGKPSKGPAAAQTAKAVLEATGLPLIVRGPGQAEADNELLVAVAEAAKGERVALGLCEDKNYRTIVAAALAHKQLVVATSPIDVNLAKQLNILISDMRLDLENVLMDPTTGALGYGLEYTYSVMERLRLAALTGDGMTQQPMICFVGEEAWRQKEARATEDVPAAWGDHARRGRLWELTTAVAFVESGADIVSIRHPDNVQAVRAAIQGLMAAI